MSTTTALTPTHYHIPPEEEIELHLRDEKVNMILFLSFFLCIWCKSVKMFLHIKKEICIWIVEATDSIFYEWMRKLFWLWSFSIKTAHSVSTITFYMHISICWQLFRSKDLSLNLLTFFFTNSIHSTKYRVSILF